jgi:hypothetical protein
LDLFGFDFDFIAMDDELGVETQRVELQGLADHVDGLICLLFRIAPG